MEAVLSLVGGLIVGLFGGVGLERYRNARKDHEHRQGYYHRLLSAADAYADAVAEHYQPDMQGAQMAMTRERQGIEVFGAKGIGDAAHELEDAINGEDWNAVKTKRARLLERIRKDVGPRRFPFGRRG